MIDTELLTQFISEELLASEITLTVDEALLADGMVDSIGVMRLVGFIEDTFDIEIPAEHILIENFKTVTSICKYIEQRQA